MAAVIARVVASPEPPHQEYLVTLPGRQPKDWSADAAAAFIFPTHGIADQVADELRKDLKSITCANGLPLYQFIHARTLEDHELTRFNRQPHTNRRGDRRRIRQDEMRQDDVRQLEESYQ